MGRSSDLDGSLQRVEYANHHYGQEGLRFICRQVTDPLSDLGLFDFVWVRFFLEYHRSRAFELVSLFSELLKPGGILCLIDLDHNCLNHYKLPSHLEEAMNQIVAKAEQDSDFDTRMGIKLYSFLYDLGFEEINVTMQAYHLIFGALKEIDDFNWNQKVDIAVRRSGCAF